MRNNLKKIAAAALMLACTSVYALPEDREQPIHISADSASIDDKTGITSYKGSVNIRQGSLEIDAAKVEMHRGSEGVEKIIATGRKNKQARFRQQSAKSEPYTDAEGNRLVYLVDKQTITVTGNAFVQQGSDKFSGEKIVYDIDKSIVNAFGGKKGKGRVQMVIQPKAKPAQ